MIKYFVLFLLVVSVTSCRTTKKVVVKKEVPNITKVRLFNNINDNQLQYNTLYAKKMDISINRNGKKDNLKASLKIKRDTFIWMSVTAPLGIEVGRVLLTPDSIKFIDSYNKKYFFSDYNYFINKFDLKLSFECIQKLLTNMFFDLESCNGNDGKEEKFKFYRTKSDYVLLNIQQKAISRKIKRFLKKKQKNKDFTFILQRIHIEPELFRPELLSLEDLEEYAGVNALYKDFKDYQGKIFPEKIILNVFMEDLKIQLELEFLKLEFDVPVMPGFRLSPKYKQIYP